MIRFIDSVAFVWTETLEPIMQELGLLPAVRNYDYLSVDDVETIVDAIRKLRR